MEYGRNSLDRIEFNPDFPIKTFLIIITLLSQRAQEASVDFNCVYVEHKSSQ